jgi:hypothetical protein
MPQAQPAGRENPSGGKGAPLRFYPALSCRRRMSKMLSFSLVSTVIFSELDTSANYF